MLLSWNEGDLAGGVGGPGGVYAQILAAWKVSQDKEDKQSSPLCSQLPRPACPRSPCGAPAEVDPSTSEPARPGLGSYLSPWESPPRDQTPGSTSSNRGRAGRDEYETSPRETR